MPTGDHEVVRAAPIVVERTTASVVLASIDLDRDLLVRVREVDAIPTAPDGNRVLLSELRKAPADDCTSEAHLEAAVTGVVSGQSSLKNALDTGRVASGRGREPGHALSEVVQAKRPFSQGAVGHTPEHFIDAHAPQLGGPV